MFRITYTQGNGYHCGCCRREWTETHDCQTEQEVIEWLSELKACGSESRYEDDNDREVQEIREIKDENLTDKFKADDTLVNNIIAERKANKEKAKKQQEEEELQRKRQQLEKLKKELGENNNN